MKYEELVSQLAREMHKIVISGLPQGEMYDEAKRFRKEKWEKAARHALSKKNIKIEKEAM